MAIDPTLAALLRKIADKQKALEEENRTILDKYEEFIQACQDTPRSITQEIDSIPGRRIWYTLGQRQSFTTAQNGLRAAALSFLVSQDGPFICTHYPLAIWKPNSPANATNFGAWSPVSSWPLPVQQITDQDIIDLSYEVMDSGSQRNFQNAAVGPIFSRPDNLIPLPVPTLFAPNTTIQFTPTFERIFFNQTPEDPTTGGELYIGFPGYRVVNM
jgi:hypothetical protein